MKTKSVTKQTNETDSVSVKVNSLKEAKEKIYSDIQGGKNYKDIAKTKFDINGVQKSFNISQISQIKAEFEPKIEENRLDNDKAEVFRLFKNGLSPTDVIIKTKFGFDFVKQSWDEYAEINEKQLVSKKVLYKIRDALRPIGLAKSTHDLPEFVRMAVDGYLETEDFYYNCCVCGEEKKIESKALQDAKKYLSSKWGHAKCISN